MGNHTHPWWHNMSPLMQTECITLHDLRNSFRLDENEVYQGELSVLHNHLKTGKPAAAVYVFVRKPIILSVNKQTNLI